MSKSSKIAISAIKYTLTGAAFFSLGACSLYAQPTAKTPESAAQVITIKLKFSNVHLIRAATPVLIDAGSPMDWELLEEKLALYNVKACDIRWVVITHAHQDHAGLASQFQQKCGTQIAMHQGDSLIAANGGFDQDLKFTSFMSRVVWKLVDYTYPAFKANLTWNVAQGESVDLSALGISGQAVSVPGHTKGSLAIALNDGRAFIGDMLAGGFFGGAISPTRASEHYFHGDSDRNYQSLRYLLNNNIHTFYLGHGGPVSRESVLQALEVLEKKERNDAPIHSPSKQPIKE
jgi:hydroxyacylglutathione hydrolase